MNPKKLFNFALLTGEIMLRNGAETSRVEDTIIRILRTSKFETTEAFVTPTGIFATLDDASIDMLTYVRRVDKRVIHLYRVSLANDVSRQFCSGKMTLEDAYARMKEIKTEPPYSDALMIFATGLAAGCFTIVFGGSFEDLCVSTIIGAILAVFQILLYRFDLSKFFIDLICGAIIAIFTIIFFHFLGFGEHFDLIIIGAIMPLVPGVAITNAVRDTIQGDLLSGLARTADAFIVASSIAIGVGSILRLYYALGGL